MTERSGDVRRVGDAVAAALGCRVLSVEVLEPGASSARTFSVSTDGGDVVAKVAVPDRSIRATARNLDVLRGLGVPVPESLAVAVLDDGREAVVMSRLPGRDLHHEISSLTAAQLSELAEQVIDIQTRAGRLPVVGGCGYVAIGEVATRSWADVLDRPNGFRYADPPPSDTAALLLRLREVQGDAASRLAGIRPRCFLDDLTTRNVLIQDGRLSGVVDLDVICQGDPRFHLGLTTAAVQVHEAPLGDHYLAELLRFARSDPDDRRFVDLYAATFLVNFLGAEHPQRPGPWRRRAAGLARTCLERAAPFFRA